MVSILALLQKLHSGIAIIKQGFNDVKATVTDEIADFLKEDGSIDGKKAADALLHYIVILLVEHYKPVLQKWYDEFSQYVNLYAAKVSALQEDENAGNDDAPIDFTNSEQCNVAYIKLIDAVNASTNAMSKIGSALETLIINTGKQTNQLSILVTNIQELIASK